MDPLFFFLPRASVSRWALPVPCLVPFEDVGGGQTCRRTCTRKPGQERGMEWNLDRGVRVLRRRC